jgi:nicotinamidase-related amidase
MNDAQMPNPARARRALLLIDFQQDFLSPRGRMPVCPSHVSPALTRAARAIDEARRSGDIVLAIGNEFKRDDHLMNLLRRGAAVEGSPGAAWSPDLPLGEARYFPKWAASAFVNPDLDDYLRREQVGTLVLAGLQAKACVKATALDALARGYRVELLADAIACVGDASRRRSLAALARRGAVPV